MRAQHQLQAQFERELQPFHMARVRLFFAAVFALLGSGRLSLSALGRAIAAHTSHKHGIKRVDRLLGNIVLQSAKAQRAFYQALAATLIQPGARPVVIIDWTAVTPGIWALTAALPIGGRALVIFAQAYPITRYMKPAVHADFLRRLAHVLPHCRPVIVADAGFRSPFMKRVGALGWDYVIRLRGARGHTAVLALDKRRYLGDNTVEARWTGLDKLYALATRMPRDIGRYLIGRVSKHDCRLIAVRKRARAAMQPVVWVNSDAAKARRSANEPWMLATSLARTSPSKIARIYSMRMQIEETFRDAKSPRFGFALDHARTNAPERVNVLLLLAAFAHLFATVLGLAARHSRLDRGFQANTVRTRAINSLAFIGRHLFCTPRLMLSLKQTLPWTSLRDAVAVV